jgi:CRISPR/Cas system-associated protein endoribonuclease Cas2
MSSPTYSPLGWKTVWLIAMFDLPVDTPAQRRAYARFRKDLLEDGFTMMQYSVYQRHCASPENAAPACRPRARCDSWSSLTGSSRRS